MRARLNPDPTSEVARRILETAVRIIITEGEAELRIQDVTEAAGVQAPMIYRHFGNREGLVQSALLADFSENLAGIASILALAAGSASSAEEFRQSFSKVLHAASDPEREGHRRRRLLVLGSAITRADVAEIIRATQHTSFEPLIEALQNAREQGWIRSDLDPAEYVTWLTTSTLALAVAEHFGTIPEPRIWWVRLQTDAALALLFGDTPSPSAR
jgi:AcrR family transcriptional regulator